MASKIEEIQAQEDPTDECFFKDGTLDEVLAVMNIALEFNYMEIFREGLFFLTILATEVT
jgi:hypothetical protein